MAMDQPQEELQEMSFLDHLEVLRWHIIRSLVAILPGIIFTFVYKDFVFNSIILAPKKAHFVTFQFLCKVSVWLHNQFPSLVGEDTLCIGQNLPKLQNVDMSGQFITHLMVAIVTGLIVGFPYIVWEFWRFIKPALKKSERKHARGFIFFTTLLFISGVLFAYYVIAPLSINFLMNYQVSDEVNNIPRLNSYNSLFISLILGCGLLFELPILSYFLARIGLVTAGTLKNYRKLAFVICLIVSAIITPPDIFSQLLVTGPLMVLYEISIRIAARVERKAKKKELAELG